MHKLLSHDFHDVLVRWSATSKASLKAHIIQTVADQLSSRLQVDTVSRSLLRFLTVAAGYPELRLQAAQRIETWMPNPKVCPHFSVIGNLIK